MAFTEEELEKREAELLDFIGVTGFHIFINDVSYWEMLDAKVKRVYKDATIPERVPSNHEQRLMKDHAVELKVKEDEIASLHNEISRKIEEVEKKTVDVNNLRVDFDKKKGELERKVEEKSKLLDEKEKVLEEKVKLVGEQEKNINELKQSLEAERSRLRDINAKLVTIEDEKRKLEKKVEKEREKVAKKEEELIKSGSELTRAKKALDTLEKEMKILKHEREEEKGELESRRRSAQAMDLKQAELSITLEKVQKLAETFAIRISADADFHVALNRREKHLATTKAELEASKSHLELILQEERRRITKEVAAELDARFKAVEPLENLMASVKEREKQCEYLL